MALEHALLVSLCEQAASGLELTRRFDRSIGFFWSATHQQIYRVLARMETDGWLSSETVAQAGRPAKRVYSPTVHGREVLVAWVGTPTAIEPLRSEVAVKIRGAAYGDREQVRAHVADLVGQHRALLATYEALLARDYPDPARLTGRDLDQYHLLRGGILAEQTTITWLAGWLATGSPTTADHSRDRQALLDGPESTTRRTGTHHSTEDR